MSGDFNSPSQSKIQYVDVGLRAAPTSYGRMPKVNKRV